MTPPRKHAFPPVARGDARILVLGSLPGDVSIAHGRYYAHPTNAFWWLIGEVIGTALGPLDYAARLLALQEAGIALWDVIASAERPGSLDGAIRAAERRDLAGFAASLPALRAVAFNGATAARIGRRALAATPLVLVDLPSSSAAFAGLGRAAKRERWLALRAFL